MRIMPIALLEGGVATAAIVSLINKITARVISTVFSFQISLMSISSCNIENALLIISGGIFGKLSENSKKGKFRMHDCFVVDKEQENCPLPLHMPDIYLVSIQERRTLAGIAQIASNTTS